MTHTCTVYIINYHIYLKNYVYTFIYFLKLLVEVHKYKSNNNNKK